MTAILTHKRNTKHSMHMLSRVLTAGFQLLILLQEWMYYHNKVCSHIQNSQKVDTYRRLQLQVQEHIQYLNVYQFSNHLSTASADFLKPYVAQFQPTAFRARFVSNPNVQSLSEQTPDSCAAQMESASYTQFSAEPAP